MHKTSESLLLLLMMYRRVSVQVLKVRLERLERKELQVDLVGEILQDYRAKSDQPVHLVYLGHRAF